jgi:hypothetical protein
MSTYTKIDDIHNNIKVVYGLCPGDPATIIVDNLLGGGGNPNNYYFNWFKKDPLNGTYPYLSTACMVNTVNRKMSASFVHPLYYAINFPIAGIFLNYGLLGAPVATVLTDLAAALQGYGRVIAVVGITLYIDFMDNDPQFGSYGCGTQGLNFIDYHVSPYPATPINNVFNVNCCGATLLNREITGWQPMAGGYGADTYTTPPGPGIYMVEIVDEVGEADYGFIEVNEEIPTCALDVVQPTCAGKNNGSITIPPFYDDSAGITFTWTKDGDPFSNQKDLANLGPGTYCVTLQNTFECQRTCCTTIIDPLPLVITVIEQINPTCVNCSNSNRFGTLLFEVTGGTTDCVDDCTSPYEYSLNNAEFQPLDFDNRKLLTRLTEGLYVLKVKDCNCCYASYTFTIKEQLINIDI